MVVKKLAAIFRLIPWRCVSNTDDARKENPTIGSGVDDESKYLIWTSFRSDRKRGHILSIQLRF